MEKDSLGLIETLGLVGAVEAADAGSKAANVTFCGYHRGLAGLITVVFSGDVAAVHAAVAAGVAAARLVGKIVSVDVIARPDRQLHAALNGSKAAGQEVPVTPQTCPPPEVIVSEEVVRPAEYVAPEISAAAAEPSPEKTDAAVVRAPEYCAVAVEEAEAPLASPAEPPAEGWKEAVPSGGNGDLAAPKASAVEEFAKAEQASPPTRNKEKVLKTRPRKKS